jgi:Fe-S cluster biogenesis protein NfuA/nitrite reductase/ring-hydroxylating ferredoxin subunit
MAGENRPLQKGDRMGVLRQAGGADQIVADGGAEDLVRQVSDLYGSGLRRIMEILHHQGKLDAATVEALTADDLVSRLLAIHGLHPHSLEAQVAAALDRIRPYLGSHGGDVELEGTSPDGVVRLKLLRAYQSGPPLSAPLKSAVEEAIKTAVPEVTAVDVVEEEKQAGSPDLIPVDSLHVRANNPAGATPAASWQDMSGGTWEPVPEIAGLESGEVAGFLIGGYPVLACRSGQDVYAYRDYCPRCTGSMAGATLQGAVTAQAGGSLLSCPTCRGHFDVRHAGACLEDKDLHLDPLPLLVQGGVLTVAIPTEAVQAAPLSAAPPPPRAPAEVTPVQAIPLVAPAGQALPSVLAPEPASAAAPLPTVPSPVVSSPALSAAATPVPAAPELS